jgi:hypothetical protein
VSVVVRYFADRGVVCAEHEARSIVREISLATVRSSVQTDPTTGGPGRTGDTDDDIRRRS